MSYFRIIQIPGSFYANGAPLLLGYIRIKGLDSYGFLYKDGPKYRDTCPVRAFGEGADIHTVESRTYFHIEGAMYWAEGRDLMASIGDAELPLFARKASEVSRHVPLGYYLDEYCDETFTPVVIRQPEEPEHDGEEWEEVILYFAGYSNPWNDSITFDPEPLSDLHEAAHAADRLAEIHAEREREYRYRSDKANRFKASIDDSHATRDAIRDAIDTLRQDAANGHNWRALFGLLDRRRAEHAERVEIMVELGGDAEFRTILDSM